MILTYARLILQVLLVDCDRKIASPLQSNQQQATRDRWALTVPQLSSAVYATTKLALRCSRFGYHLAGEAGNGEKSPER